MAGPSPNDAAAFAQAPDSAAALMQSSATPGGISFPPIADYAFPSDCETCALIAPGGNVEWMCVPRMDGPSIFAAVMDRQGDGTAAQMIVRALGVRPMPQVWSSLGDEPGGGGALANARPGR